MRSKRLVLIAAAVAVCLFAATPTSADNGRLTGSVGPGFAISVTDSSGATVKHLDPGTYTLLVPDLSEEHDFHLSGPSVDVSTDILFVGDTTFTITVKDGTYSFVCDAHPSRMQGLFTAGTAPPPTTTTTALPAGREAAHAARRGQSHWTVTLKAGSYRVFSDAHPTLARTIRVA